MYVSTLYLSSDTPEEGIRSQITDACELPCGCLELNSGPLKEQISALNPLSHISNRISSIPLPEHLVL